MSVLLLIERSRVGNGPKIPLRDSYSRVRVEGLAGPGKIILHLEGLPMLSLEENGIINLPEQLEKGDTICAELCSAGSCVTVQLEA